MSEHIAGIVVGCICIVIGILNTKGNIGSLHAYHRKRVREQDIIPFGRKVGAGTICCGVGMLLYGALGCLARVTSQELCGWLGTLLLFICLAVGLPICLSAIIRYNKWIF